MIKILVAEDEARSRTALVSRLRSILGETALIETAADGNEAVKKRPGGRRRDQKPAAGHPRGVSDGL